jgi:hypothetical protein
MYLLTLLSSMSMPSLSTSPWIRGALQEEFSRHILRISSRTSREMTGRPGWPGRTFQVQGILTRTVVPLLLDRSFHLKWNGVTDSTASGAPRPSPRAVHAKRGSPPRRSAKVAPCTCGFSCHVRGTVNESEQSFWFGQSEISLDSGKKPAYSLRREFNSHGMLPFVFVLRKRFEFTAICAWHLSI